MVKVPVNLSASLNDEIDIVIQDEKGNEVQRGHVSGYPGSVNPIIQVEAEMTQNGLTHGDDWHITFPNGQIYNTNFSYIDLPVNGDPVFVFKVR